MTITVEAPVDAAPADPCREAELAAPATIAGLTALLQAAAPQSPSPPVVPPVTPPDAVEEPGTAKASGPLAFATQSVNIPERTAAQVQAALRGAADLLRGGRA